jgi:hypothetical protein
LFYVSDAAEVLVEFLAVGVAEFGGEGFGLFQDKIEEAFVVLRGDGLALFGVFALCPEDAFEGELGVMFRWQGNRVAFPCEVILVCTTVA